MADATTKRPSASTRDSRRRTPRSSTLRAAPPAAGDHIKFALFVGLVADKGDRAAVGRPRRRHLRIRQRCQAAVGRRCADRESRCPCCRRDRRRTPARSRRATTPASVSTNASSVSRFGDSSESASSTGRRARRTRAACRRATATGRMMPSAGCGVSSRSRALSVCRWAARGSAWR